MARQSVRCCGKSQQELVEYIRENLERREPFYSRARLIVACDSMSDEYVARHVEMYMENSQPKREQL